MMLPECKNPGKCQHWKDWIAEKDFEYDWCHICAMEHDCFEPIEEKEAER